MNNFLTLIAIFVVFIQIQTALSQPNQLIQQLCKRNRYQALCVSTLNLDPRSKTSNLQGLGSISIDATTKKVNETLNISGDLFEKAVGRANIEMYGTCIEAYAGAIRRFLPEALANLKTKKYSSAVSNMEDVLRESSMCGSQWATGCPLPLAKGTKGVHDIADMTIDIIKYLSTN